jgi:hypothetical protein
MKTIIQAIKDAAQRMRGVVIEATGADILRIGDRVITGETAANLISEAHAYAEHVTFQAALAFVVEGYLEDH